MNIFVKCPHCGRVLQITSATGLENNKATCPKCKSNMTFGEFLPQLSLKVGNRNYQLHFGRQWVGRKKEGNDAEVQIPDETRYMSRKHAVIELRCAPQGVVCTFEENGKNPTRRGGIELIKGDIIYLNVNDCLTLGETPMYLANEFEE